MEELPGSTDMAGRTMGMQKLRRGRADLPFTGGTLRIKKYRRFFIKSQGALKRREFFSALRGDGLAFLLRVRPFTA